MTGEDTGEIIHASAVAVAGQAALIIGASGTGKSGLALDLISRGGKLVADDRTSLSTKDDHLIASSPKAIRGKIEARGVGILALEPAGQTPVRLVVDMDKKPLRRLPEPQEITLLGIRIELICGATTPNLAAAIQILLQGARLA